MIASVVFFPIKDSAGKIISFMVREIRTYDPEADTVDIFTSLIGAHPNFITCAGAWNEFQKSYNERLVVFTDLIH